VVESPPAHDAIAPVEIETGRFESRSLVPEGTMRMTISRLEIERFSVTSSRPFEAVVAALKDGVGRLDLVEFAKASKQAGTFAELKEVIDRSLGKTGLMLFMELDHGAVLRKETELTTPKIVRLVIGNPLVMKEMAKHVPEAGSYAPVTILVDERGDSVHLSYDRMASLLAPYGNMDAIAVARDLDSKNRDPSSISNLNPHNPWVAAHALPPAIGEFREHRPDLRIQEDRTEYLVKPVEDLVDAALVGLPQGELVTIPGLYDGDAWTRFEAAGRQRE